MGYFGARKTPGGFVVGEVVSALQKSIRRGDEEGALTWATELDRAGFGDYVWKRLRIIASEDVGIGDPAAMVATRVLYEAWRARATAEKKAWKDGDPQPRVSRLYLVEAVKSLARARKSRIGDHVYLLFFQGDRAQLAPRSFRKSWGKAELVSAFEQALYGSREEEALFLAAELDEQDGSKTHVWPLIERLAASRPVASPVTVVLRLDWEQEAARERKTKIEPSESRLILGVAIVSVMRDLGDPAELVAKVDELTATETIVANQALVDELYRYDRKATVTIPDHALDQHTQRGRRLGRGIEYSFSENGPLHLENRAGVDDPYEERAIASDIAHHHAQAARRAA
ncbi:MAG TPA: hypothetical protein VG265_13480 [Gaiellaceae bacterium]|nr:hypothetical protein [Gaiellaceae bacterium]